ncbi:MAG: biotin--[acetyl-CoA-carboxylase] ligase [Candidatus Dormibacteria bacterium]
MVKNRTFAVHHVARTASTQDLVRAAARAGAVEGYCCLADEQTAGRGRQDRRWVAAPGTALLASVLVRVAAGAAAGIPFAAGVAMVDALADTCDAVVQLKWPNDVLCRSRKLAGILVELDSSSREDTVVAVIGLGLNITVKEFPEGAHAISLMDVTHEVPSTRALLDVWLRALDTRLQQLEAHGMESTLAQWRRHDAGLGSVVEATDAHGGVLSGVARDIAPDGALLIETSHGVQRLIAGDVHLVAR